MKMMIVIVVLCATGFAEPPQPKPILNQNEISDQACGPCSVINAMAWGNEALRKRLADLPGDSLADKASDFL